MPYVLLALRLCQEMRKMGALSRSPYFHSFVIGIVICDWDVSLTWMQLYDYQYNMGLLLMERKEWNTKMEKLKASAQDADENLRRELAAHLIAISEAENREESLKAALTAERKHACDVSIFVLFHTTLELHLCIASICSSLFFHLLMFTCILHTA